jgi:hypothetical protein
VVLEGAGNGREQLRAVADRADGLLGVDEVLDHLNNLKRKRKSAISRYVSFPPLI